MSLIEGFPSFLKSIHSKEIVKIQVWKCKDELFSRRDVSYKYHIFYCDDTADTLESHYMLLAALLYWFDRTKGDTMDCLTTQQMQAIDRIRAMPIVLVILGVAKRRRELRDPLNLLAKHVWNNN